MSVTRFNSQGEAATAAAIAQSQAEQAKQIADNNAAADSIEVNLLNRLEALRNMAKHLAADLRRMPATSAAGVKQTIGTMHTVDQRWVSIGVTHLQEGLMAIERAIMQSEEF